MSSIRPNLDTLLSIAERWIRADNGVFGAGIVKNSISEVWAVEPYELACFHPLFAQSLEEMLLWKQKNHQRSHATRSEVIATLSVLRNGVFDFKDIQNDTVLFTNLNTLHIPSDKEKHIWVDGDLVLLKKAGLNNTGVPFVTACQTAGLTVSRADLDLRYPGWEERWRIGKELGVDTKVLLKEVFNQTAASLSPESLTGLTFD